MKKIILVLLLTFPMFAQQINTFDFAVINSALISPNIDMTNDRSVVATNNDQFSAYFQGTLDIGVDDMIVAGSVDKSMQDRTYMLFIGKMVNNFRATIDLGYVDSFSSYRGSFAGFSFSWHPLTNGYVGLSVINLHSVSIEYDDDIDNEFDYYKKLTPKLFASYEIIPNVIVFGQLSSRVNDIALKYQNKRFLLGGFYSGNGNQGVFGAIKVWRFDVSCSTTFEKVNFGLKFE